MAELDLSRRIVYPVDAKDAARVRRGLVYRSDDGKDLLMDVYTPPGRQRSPAVLFVHGGPIHPLMPEPRTWGIYISYGELAAASGFAGVTFNHRFYSPETFETAQADAKAAVEYVRANADELGIDPDRICLWAFSGGGPLLAWAWRERPAHVRGLVGFYPFLTLDARVGGLPILVGRGGLDNLPRVNESIDTFVRDALSANVTLDLLNHPHGHHAFDIRDDDDRSREIIARAIAFVQARFNK
jgi:dienelactone hydrolase